MRSVKWRTLAFWPAVTHEDVSVRIDTFALYGIGSLNNLDVVRLSNFFLDTCVSVECEGLRRKQKWIQVIGSKTDRKKHFNL